MLNWIFRNIIAIISILCFAVFCYLAGVLSSTLGLPPSYRVKYTVEAAIDLYENHEAYFYDIPVQHLRPKRFPGNGVVVSQPEKMAPGVTFMSGLFGNRLTARLYASDGTLLREWPFDVFKAMPNEMAYQFDALTHGHHLYPNGDIVLVLSGRGLVRVSACGDILWQNSLRSHHALDIDDAGDIWTPTGPHKYEDKRFDPAPFRIDRIAKFDPLTGRKIGEIDIINAVTIADKLGLIRTHPVALNDMMHLNDVEILSENLAPAFPMFEAGDLLLSSRFYNQIWVLDGSDQSLKWVYGGTMIAQHDPDFQPNGTITVLDNNYGGPMKSDPNDVGANGGSRILAIDPATNSATTLYSSSKEDPFYTERRGKHQVLSNGNILIAETDAGRAFEVSTDGEIVWAFINQYDEKQVGWIMQATRYAEDYTAIQEIECSKD